MAHALDLKRIDLYIRYDQPVNSDELKRFRDLIKRRIQREPVAYIVGTKEFWSMELLVSRNVLIPRPETECLVEKVLSLFPEKNLPHLTPSRILEIGTGSGAVILALAAERPGHLFYASDVSIPAIELAKKNAARHHLEHKILFFSGDLFDCLREENGYFNLILSNPPYIPSGQINGLQPEIIRYEPRTALDGKQTGLYYIQKIISNACKFLKPEGSLVMEIGHDQKNAVREISETCHAYDKVSFEKDYAGCDRIVYMRKRALD